MLLYVLIVACHRIRKEAENGANYLRAIGLVIMTILLPFCSAVNGDNLASRV